MRIAGFFLLMTLGLAMTGCDTVGVGQLTGSGSSQGTAAGNQFGNDSGVDSTEAAAAIDALISDDIEELLSKEDRLAVYEAQHRALEYNRSGSPVAWKNPDTKHNGEVIPGPSYTINTSRCRDYTHTIYVDGQPRVLRGTACRQRQGNWRTIS